MIIQSLDICFHYICFACYFYIPNKANKKKIKQLFESISYFMPSQYQNSLFKIIQKYPIETFYDKKESMMDYGYIIYRDFNIDNSIEYLSYNDYLDKFYLELYKDNRVYKKWIKHIIFVFTCILIIYYIYTNK
jgi:hypothetical protein